MAKSLVSMAVLVCEDMGRFLYEGIMGQLWMSQLG